MAAILKKLKDGHAKNANVVILSLAFFFSYCAFFTMGNIQTVILESAQDPNSTGYVEGFEGDGYVSLSIVFAISFVCDFFTPTIVTFLGLKLALICGSSTVAVFIASFYFLNEGLLYAASAILGVGTAVIWVAQGSHISKNSEDATIDRNSGFFYMLWTASGVIGNMYSYFQFKESSEIDPDTRFLFVTVLFVLSCAGTCTLMLLLPMPWVDDREKKAEGEGSEAAGTWQMFLNLMRLIATRDMALLMIFFCYSGFMFSFWTGVYGPSLSFSESFEGDQSNSLSGLHGIFAQAGGMAVGVVMATFGGYIKSVPRYVLVLGAIACHFVSYTVILLNVPEDSPLGETNDVALLVIPSSTGLVIFSSFVMGLGTGMNEIQTLALLGSTYSDRADYAFAVLKLCHHGSMGVGFAYAGYLTLYWQLGILFTFGTLGAVCFTFVDVRSRRGKQKQAGEEKGDVEKSSGSALTCWRRRRPGRHQSPMQTLAPIS